MLSLEVDTRQDILVPNPLAFYYYTDSEKPKRDGIVQKKKKK